MQRFVRAKLHGIRVTGADLNYHGSITLDPEIRRQADLDPLEFVEIWNKNSGRADLDLRALRRRQRRCRILNGAAARTGQGWATTRSSPPPRPTARSTTS